MSHTLSRQVPDQFLWKRASKIGSSAPKVIWDGEGGGKEHELLAQLLRDEESVFSFAISGRLMNQRTERERTEDPAASGAWVPMLSVLTAAGREHMTHGTREESRGKPEAVE